MADHLMVNVLSFSDGGSGPGATTGHATADDRESMGLRMEVSVRDLGLGSDENALIVAFCFFHVCLWQRDFSSVRT
jgi:hypothetical protein